MSHSNRFRFCPRLREATARPISILLVVLVLLVFLYGCKRNEKRPFGYLRLGYVEDFLGPETYLKEHNLLVRRDSNGIYAMSTQCTYDLSPLIMTTSGPSAKFVSKETKSEYDYQGKVIQGPAEAPLPYYEVFLDAREYDGPPNTLYVKVGVEKDPKWRMPIPLRFLPETDKEQ